MATDIKFFHSEMTGAPTLNGVAGTLIAVLDACLVNGFGSGTVDSVVIASGIATVTRSTGHPFEVGSIATIAGATVTGGSINGEHRVLSVTVTTYTFDATGISNQTATGTITHKLSPAGFTKDYSGTNLAAYKSGNVSATAALLRVDDTGTTVGRVVGYESMSDVNTGSGPFPTAAQVSGGAYIGKSATADSTTRKWALAADDRAFYLFVQHSGTAGYSSYFFGDFLSAKSPDAYGAALSAWGSNITATAPGASSTNEVHYCDPSTDHNFWAPRGASGLGSSQRLRRSSVVPYGNAGQFSGSTGFAYPNPADNGLWIFPMFITENAASVSYRGQQPGVYYAAQAIGISTFATKDSVTGVVGLSGRTLKAILSGAGPTFVDITGPWR